MIWMAWRQHSRQALSTLVALLALAAVMVPTGVMMHQAADRLGLDDCRGLPTTAPESAQIACSTAVQEFADDYSTLGLVGILFLAIPLLMGILLGAPLVAREIEHGTHRLAWTQGVSRVRWTLVKVALIGAIALVASTVYGLGLIWWFDPLSVTGSRFGPVVFDMQGVVPIGYTLFSVALGVFAGTMRPKVLPAMAITLAGFVGLRVALTVLARPRFLPAQIRSGPVWQFATADDGNTVPIRPADTGEWKLHRDFVLPDGTIAENDLTAGPDYQEIVVYQPGDRFWFFQAIETGIFVALAVLLIALAIRRIQRLA
jgi:hypothetical protein